MTDTVSDFCFAPTAAAAANLGAEGIESGRVWVTGNTVVDALEEIRSRPLPLRNPGAAELPVSGRRLVLLTAHRRESFGRPLERVFEAVASLVRLVDDVDVLYPVHPIRRSENPRSESWGGTRGSTCWSRWTTAISSRPSAGRVWC